jgi:ribosome-associated translation inhibitor RaiA
MQLTIDCSQELTKDALKTMKIVNPKLPYEKYVEILKPERLLMYKLNSFSFEATVQFYNRCKGYKKYENVIVGLEQNLRLLDYLKSIRAQRIQAEFDIGKTRLDAIAMVDGNLNTYEAKCSSKLGDKCIRQISDTRRYFDKLGLEAFTNIFVLKDTYIEPKLEIEIKNLDTNIIRSNETKKDIFKSIEKLQDRFVEL